MGGISLLRRSRLEEPDEIYRYAATDEDCLAILAGLVSRDTEPGSVSTDTEGVSPVSGIIFHMLSSSLTASAIEGLASVSSWQHLSANDTNF